MNKFFRVIIIVFTIAIMAICAKGVYAATYEDFEYEIVDGEIKLTSWKEQSIADINIPSEIEGMPVTIIGEGTFRYCDKLTGRLIIPNTVKIIEKQAFYECTGLSGELIIPDTVEVIGSGAFYNCSGLDGELKLSKGLKEIGGSAFYQCTKLTGKLEFGDNLKKIGAYAFYKCKNIGGDLIIPANVEEIEAYTFYDCDYLEKLILPEGLKKIEAYAFCGCNFKGDLIIPESVNEIQLYAFYFGGFDGILKLPSEITEIGMGAFSDCNFKGDLLIPKGLEVIPSMCFSSSGFDGTLTIQEGTRIIADDAFWNCGFKDDLVIPESIEYIGEEAFEYCRSIQNVKMPMVAPKLGYHAFLNCNYFIKYGSTGYERWTNITVYDKPIELATIHMYNDLVYDGTEKEPITAIYFEGVKLTENEDYTIEYKNNIDIGTATAVITGKGIYIGQLEKTFEIRKIDMRHINIEVLSDKYTYTGERIRPEIRISCKDYILVEGTDYVMTDDYNELPGKANVKIKGIGKFDFKKTIEFEIYGDINSAFIDNGFNFSYIGKPITPEFDIIHSYSDGGGRILEENVDYKIEYKNNINPGKATVVLTGMGYYSGTKEETFNIVANMNEVKIDIIQTQYYTGKEIKPKLTVKLNDYLLIEGVDYEVEYSCNIEPGVSYINVKGINHMQGTAYTQFNIIADISKATIEDIETQYHTGKSITPKLTITNGEIILQENIDYTLEYKNNKNVGTATVIIKGIGKYSGEITTTFNIRYNISKATVGGIQGKTYTGSKQTQSLKVKYGSTTLKKDKDYTVSYSNNVNAGTTKVTITGKGNYAGTKTVTFKIARRSISKLTYSKVSSYTYTGKAITPNVTVKYGKTKLVKDKDYTVAYGKNVNSGTATITITGKGNYAGTKKITFAIKDRSISSATITGLKSKTYTGSKQTQSLTLTYNGMTLKNGTHYTLSYKSNINAGTASVTITGKGNFNGSKTLKFKIWDRNINELSITASKSLGYTGNKREPSVTVKYGSKTLKKNTDYKVVYSNNVNVGTGKITVTGIGNYTGTKVLTFEITKRSITSASIKGLAEKTYTGSKLTQSLKLTYGGKTLKNGTHYTLTYANNVKAGTASVTITGKGNFYGEKTLTYKIARRSISKLTYSKVSSYTYTGKAITPNVTVKYGKTTLVKDTDYTVAYSKNVNSGTATITITGKGNYAGTKKITFSIKDRSISSATVQGLVNKEYNGKKQYQSIKLIYNGIELKNGTDYTISYKNNISVGTATMTITGKGNFTGTKKVTFRIESGKYYIKVNYKANVVTIYEKGADGKYNIPVKAMICSTGIATPKSGKYTIKSRWTWLKLYGGVYGHYTTQITGDILFHSVPYLDNSPDTLEYWEYDKLGTAASLGCVRLTTQDAKWIYDNIPRNTTVEFYASTNPGPLGKPTSMKISDYKEYRNWDPTDPNSKNPWKEIL